MPGKMSSVVTIVENFRKRSVCLYLRHLVWQLLICLLTDYKLRNNRICSRSNTSLGSRLVIHRYAPPWCKSSWIRSLFRVGLIISSSFFRIVTGADPRAFHHDGSSAIPTHAFSQYTNPIILELLIPHVIRHSRQKSPPTRRCFN